MDLGRSSGIGARLRLFPRYVGRLADRFWAPVYLTIFTAVLVIQIFLPPVAGMADNGDAGRVMGDLGLTPNYPPADRYFGYFTPDYLAAPTHGWGDGPFYTGRLAVRVAEWIGRCKPPGHFDVRWLGFVHLVIYVLVFALLLRALRNAPGLVRYTAPAAAIWIFGDVFYASYLNSFYTDTMGFLCYLAMAACMAMIFSRDHPAWTIFVFVAAALLFAESKPLNGGDTVIVGLSVAVFTAVRWRGARRYFGGSAGAIAFLAGLNVIAATPWFYSYPAILDVLMVRIAPTPNGPAALAEFGLVPSDMRFAGMHAFVPQGPGFDPGFASRFRDKTAADLIRWYLRHPGQTLQFLNEDLHASAQVMRPPLGNFEKQYGLGRVALSHSFSSWSDGRSSLLRRRPMHILLLYGLSFVPLLAAMVRKAWRPLLDYGVYLASMALLGMVQFGSASLLDAVETPRHLFMFHVTTDVLFLLLFCSVLWPLGRLLDRSSAKLFPAPGV